MKKKVNKTTVIGLDSIEITVNQHIQAVSTEIKSTRTKTKLGYIKPLLHGTRISLCLPRTIREDNIDPFGLLDACHLVEVVKEITEKLEELQIDTSQARVTKVEINATATLDDPAHVPAILQLLAMMFLQSGQKAFLVVHGEQDKMFQNVPLEREIMRTRPVIESIKTQRLKNGRFSLKVYNKNLESGIEDKGLLRLEQVHNRESLNYVGVSDVLRDFLTIENITSLVDLYKRDFRDYFLEPYWTDPGVGITPPKRLVNTIASTLETERPLSAALIHRDLLAVDFELFQRAAVQFYGPDRRKQALQAVRRVRQSGKVETKEGAITEFVQICRAIVK